MGQAQMQTILAAFGEDASQAGLVTRAKERELVDHAEEGAAGMRRLVAAREGGLLQAGEKEAAQQALRLFVAEAAQVDDQDLAFVDNATEVQRILLGAQHVADLGLE